MTQTIRIEGQKAILVDDGRDIPPEVTFTISAGQFANAVRAGMEAGKAWRLGAEIIVPLLPTQTVFQKDKDGRLVGVLERKVIP